MIEKIYGDLIYSVLPKALKEFQDNREENLLDNLVKILMEVLDKSTYYHFSNKELYDYIVTIIQHIEDNMYRYTDNKDERFVDKSTECLEKLINVFYKSQSIRRNIIKVY